MNVSCAFPGFKIREFHSEFGDKFVGKCLHGRDIDYSHFTRGLASIDSTDHGESGDVGLTSSSWGTNQHVLVALICHVKDYALDLIEVFTLKTCMVRGLDFLSDSDKFGLNFS